MLRPSTSARRRLLSTFPIITVGRRTSRSTSASCLALVRSRGRRSSGGRKGMSPVPARRYPLPLVIIGLIPFSLIKATLRPHLIEAGGSTEGWYGGDNPRREATPCFGTQPDCL